MADEEEIAKMKELLQLKKQLAEVEAKRTVLWEEASMLGKNIVALQRELGLRDN